MPGLFSQQATAPYVQQVAQQANADENTVQQQQQAQPKEKKGLPPLMMAGLVGSELFDAGTTQHLLKNYSDVRESNPILPTSPALMYGIKGGMGALQALALNKLSQSGHPTLAKGLGLLNMAIPTAAGIHNLTLK